VRRRDGDDALRQGHLHQQLQDALLDRMRQAADAHPAVAEGVAIAREIAAGLRGSVQGLQVSTHSGDIEAALAVLDGLR
jgi:hypothetical protein